MSRAVITGATGFVGANLARRLLTDGEDVHLFVLPHHTAWRIRDIRGHVQLHDVDLEDRDAVHGAMRSIKPVRVFHLAAHGAYSWQTDVRRIVQTNLIGTINLVDASVDAGVETVVNTGSSSEYGYKDHAPVESEALEPNSEYAVAKAAATMFCRLAAQTRNVRIPTLRLYSVYGPYEEPNRLVPALVVRGLDRTLPPLANPDTARDYVYVDDVVDAYLRVARAPLSDPGAVYNVGTGTQTRLREIVDVARALLDVTTEPVWGTFDDRRWDTAMWKADTTRIRTEVGWSASHGLEAGLRETIRWFRDNDELQSYYRQKLR
jgi:nucleoside-diphosphate-sugar epimerase